MNSKNICISLLIIGIIILSAIYFNQPKTKTEYLRIHIRANSNCETDQSVKIKVRDKIVEYLTPYIAECKTKQDAENFLKDNLKEIEKVADKTLKSNGFDYKSKASVKKEDFPTRVYEDVTLEGGIYDALIVNLGSGDGDNWWCVVYPPLCFTETNNFIYKSKIKEIIAEWKANR